MDEQIKHYAIVNGTKCEVQKSKYMNGRIALRLIDCEDGCPYAIASVNLVNSECPEGHTYIKDYSENEGVLAALIQANIVDDTLQVEVAGYELANLVKVLI